MIDKIVYQGKVDESGVLKIVHRSYFDAEISQHFTGRQVEITIRRVKARRSYNQNAFLHVLLTILSKELVELTGDKSLTMQRIKDMVKLKFLLRDIVNEETGEILGQEVLHTADLNKEDFAAFIEDIYRWAAKKFHIVLPAANTQQQLI